MSDILFLCPTAHLDLIPSIKRLACILADAGFSIDILSIQNVGSPQVVINHPNVTLRYVPWKQKGYKEPVVKIITAFLPWALRYYLRDHYGCIVGAGIRGLYVGSILTLVRSTPLVYHSLELYPSWEQRSPLRRLAKAWERWANRRCKWTIIQDELRAGLLCSDNGVPQDRIILMPNAPSGKASRTRSSFLREKFAIPINKKILLFAGTLFAEYSPTLPLIRKAQAWPDDWVLVLHSNIALDKVFLDEIRKTDIRGRVILSCEPLPSDRIGVLISSADIGLALYMPQDDNMLNIGLSSGKLAEYLKSGLPVVVSNLRYIADIVQNYNCGIVINDLESLENAIKRILSEYEVYAENSVRCFNEILSLDIYSPKIVQAFRQIVEKG